MKSAVVALICSVGLAFAIVYLVAADNLLEAALRGLVALGLIAAGVWLLARSRRFRGIGGRNAHRGRAVARGPGVHGYREHLNVPLGSASRRATGPHSTEGDTSPFSEGDNGRSQQLTSSVFTRRGVHPGEVFLVQVFAHLQRDERTVAALAREFDDQARRRGFVPFQSTVAHGERLTFQLRLPGLTIDDDTQSMIWTSQPQSVQFGVAVPDDCRFGTVIGTVIVSRDSVPIGTLKFQLSIHGGSANPWWHGPTHRAGLQRYRRAFISYAAADRDEVLKRTQMLAEVGIGFFQDILSVDPGERWERRLYTEIDHCDVFFLFWSSAAKKSEWVLKEVDYAMTRNGGNDLARPDILPVIIEGPPPVEPPAKLAHLHFNDRILYFMQPKQST